MKASRIGLWTAVLLLAVCSLVYAKSKSGHAFLGITPGEVTSDIAADYGVEAGKGVLVEGVVDESTAEKAGLRENDIITQIGGATLTGPEELRVQLAKYKPEDKVSLTYLRGGKSKTIDVELGGHKERTFNFNLKGNTDGNNFFWGKHKDDSDESEKVAFAGVVTQELSEGLSTYFKVKKGALISEVVKDSPAEKAGLKPGDVIVKIGSEDIEDEQDVREAIREHKKGDVVEFVIYRDGSEQRMSVTLAEKEMDYGFFEGNIEDLSIPGGQVQIVKDLDLQDLEDDLKSIEIELKDHPIKTDLRRIHEISNSTWGEHWDHVKDQWKAELKQLKAEFEQLRIKMQELRMELSNRKS